jgi:hypothetical protein
MEIPHEATLLRVFIGESDRYEHRLVYEAIILKAREMQLAGATALRDPMGFGKSSRMYTSKILRRPGDDGKSAGAALPRRGQRWRSMNSFARAR